LVSLVRFMGLLFKRQAAFGDMWEDADVKLAALIIIGSVPTGIIGILFRKIADQLFSSVFLVGCALLVTGLLLWITRWIEKEGKDLSGFSVKDALLIGTVQGLAITPGISRSGSTIATGLLLGLSRETAARYSFLLSIPAIIGAVGAEMLSLKYLSAQTFDMATLLGTVVAGVVGYFALALLVYIVKKGQLHFFSPYCWFVGASAMIWGW
jgi:undecaprenyl-diphosphatase